MDIQTLKKQAKVAGNKHRGVLILVILILLNVMVRPTIAKEDAYSARLGKPDAPNELVIYFSLGCSHCLTYFDKHNMLIQNYIDRGLLKVELIEVAGLIDKSDDEKAYKKAQTATVPVSKTYACVAEENPEKAFEYIRIFVKSAKVALNGSTLAWNKWPYAKIEDLNPLSNSPFFNAKAKNVQQELAKLFFLESEVKGDKCLSKADDKRLAHKVSAQLDRFIESNYSGVPVVIFNGEYVPPKKHTSMFINISMFDSGNKKE